MATAGTTTEGPWSPPMASMEMTMVSGTAARGPPRTSAKEKLAGPYMAPESMQVRASRGRPGPRKRSGIARLEVLQDRERRRRLLLGARVEHRIGLAREGVDLQRQ